ncbi:transposase [Tenacibaculum sp. 190524A02b]|uniref:Transposase n=1 Tax=Tenacibaculum vairaonense TaxID=3137860 RepID=A0ABP1F558_9FLAO
MKNYAIIIGIDSNSKTILQHEIISNTKPKINLFLKKIMKKHSKENILVAFENTGVYGYHLAILLDKIKIDYSNISALEINKSKGIKRGKSDKTDALIIAQYALANGFKLELSSFTEQHLTKLKILHTQREKIVKTIKAFGNNKETELFLPKKSIKGLVKTTRSIIKNLKKNLKLIDSKILEIINSHEKLNKNYELIQSVPGIGPQTATYILIVTKGFIAFDNARQLACYAGVAPFPYQSGTSIRGRNKVSHLADKKLKALLNMCALNAKKYDYQLKKYFDEKVEKGKNKMLVLNNIKNKLLHRIFAVIKRQQPYVNTHNFAA